MEPYVGIQELAAADTACRIAVRRAEDARQESRILGYLLITLVAVFVLAISVVVGFAVAGKTIGAILTGLAGIADLSLTGVVWKQRGDANDRAKGALEDAKNICGSGNSDQAMEQLAMVSA
jgi:hypothetical protein